MFQNSEPPYEMFRDGSVRYAKYTMRHWIDLCEAFAHAFKIGTKTIEVFKNPSRKEYLEALADNDAVRAFLVGNDALVWTVYGSTHGVVAREMHLPDTRLPVVLFAAPGQECVANVTDHSQNTVWGHNPKVVAEIESHPYLRRMFTEITVSFYDEDIVGDWRNLPTEQ